MSTAAATCQDIHPPKVETFDVPAMTNTDPKGFVRAVDEYREEPFGLYLARPTPGRAQFGYLESWLLPGCGLRVTDFWFRKGHERDQDFYLDIVGIDRVGRVWRTEDYYLDLVLATGRRVEVVDTDELLAAMAAGLLSRDTTNVALRTAYRTVDGLAANGYDLSRWLSTMHIELGWQRR